MSATGTIITEASWQGFIGPTNLAILSQFANTGTTDNVSAIQSAINAAEARIYGRLLIPQASPGVTFFRYPFIVGGVPLLSAAGSISFSALQFIAHEYATFAINRWRQALSVPEDVPAAGGIAKMCAGYDTDGDKRIAEIIRWVWGYSEQATYLDLDLNAGATIGAPCQAHSAPQSGGSQVNPDGTPIVAIIENQWPVWPVYGYVQPFYFGGNCG